MTEPPEPGDPPQRRVGPSYVAILLPEDLLGGFDEWLRGIDMVMSAVPMPAGVIRVVGERGEPLINGDAMGWSAEDGTERP